MTFNYKENIVESFHGTKVADPYRWLEEPDSERSIQWTKKVNEKCDAYFSATTRRKADKKRLEEVWNYPKYFVPQKVKGTLFYQKSDGLQNQAILYKRENGKDEVTIDPNTLSDDGTVAMTNFVISNNAKYIAYATATHGSDWQEIHIRNVQTGEELNDHIQHVKFTNIAWAPDSTGFYYSRFPQPGTVKKEDESNYNKVYFHKLGQVQEEDILIHEQPTEKELMFSPLISTDEKYLLLYVMLGTATENRLYVKKLGSKDDFIKLLDDQDAEYNYITNEENLFYFKTNKNAPNGKVIAIDIENPERENWQDIIVEQQNVIDDVEYMEGKFFVSFLHDAHYQLHVYDINGNYGQEIELPILGSFTNITKSKEDREIFFGITSFLHPTTVLSYHVDTGKLEILFKSDLPVNTDAFETKQVFYSSKDGTKVPMFITCKKELNMNGENPVILYGYGGFNISMTPAFNPAILPWLEKGGIYAVANLRGGNEYGEEWHRAGMLENKQNVFDDFISAGEWLIENNYTKKEKLSIMGGSNGGLLVAACMVQRPDLFGAVICRVPVIDMLRYHKFTIGRYWTPEYGSADQAKHFPFLYAYSPLHNIKDGQKYPPTLIATAESDDRVVPAHAKKFAATLWEKAHPDSTIILRLESKAGHGLGKPTSKVIDEWVDFYAFLDKELN